MKNKIMKNRILIIIILTLNTNIFAQIVSKDEIKLLYDVEKYEDCIKATEQSINSSNNNYSKGFYYAIKAAATAKTKNPNFEEIEKEIEKAKKIAPNNPEMWAYLGTYETNKFIAKNNIANTQIIEKAEKYFKKAVALDSTNQRAYTLASDFYADLPDKISLRNISFAISFDRRALMMKPDKLGLLGYYKMAKHLEKRAWSKKERIKNIDKINQQIQKESDSFSKNRYYEGFMPLAFVKNYYNNPWQSIGNLSDKEEAQKIYSYIKKTAKNDTLGKFLKSKL